METNSNAAEVDNLEDTLKNSDSYVQDMLKFFDEGWDARGADERKNFEARLRANVVTTVTYINEVILQFSKLKLPVNEAYIKLENPNSLSVLLSVPNEVFLNKDLFSIYKYTHSIEQKSRSENYRVAFLVTYDGGSLNKDCLMSEGFIKTHTVE